MDSFALKPEKPSRSGMIWNILTIFLLVGVVCLAVFFLTIFIDPGSALNPFPPEPTPTMIQPPTATVTPIQLAPTWTASPSVEPSPTRTGAPTWTSIPSNTPFMVATPSAVPSGTSMPTATSLPITVNITYLQSTTYHPEAGCNWFGVAGQAVDKNNNPIAYLAVHVFGTIDGTAVDRWSLTATAPSYGQAGFEIVLGDHPVASHNTLWVQLVDPQSGSLPLTDKVYFDTFADCGKNLIMVRFKKTR